MKHFRRGRLLLQRLSKVSGALAKVVGALTQFVEQPRVLDGDNSLSGEILDQRDLLVSEGKYFTAVNADDANKGIVLQHRYGQASANASQFDRLDHSRVALNVGLRCC